MENGVGQEGGFSPFGTPIANSTRSLLSPRPGSSSSNHSTGSSSVSSSHRPLVQRLKGQDLYGGPVTFGGGNASSFFRQRRERLLAASPYGGSMGSRKRIADSSSSKRSEGTLKDTSSSSVALSLGAPPADAMSSTAKLILDTLERMSTPLRDARKIPVSPSPDISRAEKRRLIAEELDSSLLSSPGGTKRKRPNLKASGSSSLNGPPVRSCFSPVPNRPAKKSSVIMATTKEEEKKILPHNGLPWTESIQAFKSTYETPEETLSSSAGGKLRLKDTAGPRSGRTATSNTSASSSLKPLPSNGWPPPEKAVVKSPPRVLPTPTPPPLKKEEKQPPVLPPKPQNPPVTIAPANLQEEEMVFAFADPSECARATRTNDEYDDDKDTSTFSFSNPKILAEESRSPPLCNGQQSSANRKLPDITSFSSGIKSGSGQEVLVGSKGLLPDITVSSGQLKKGSVLSVLSKLHEPSKPRNARL